jgi:hypothetical protein
MTTEEKLEALRKAWGYVEVTQATLKASGWKVWVVRNYTGPHLSGSAVCEGLPGNPKAKRRYDYTAIVQKDVINRAYEQMKLSRMRKR